MRPCGLLTVCLALLSFASAQESRQETLVHDGLEREYYLYVPADLDEPAPLVLVLHGRGGDGPGMAELTEFDRLADEHGFIAVYPSGIEQQWNYVYDIPGYDLPTDDLGFLHALIAELRARYQVDPSRIYAAGFSNGGFMAQRLACDASDLFAAFASVGAAGFGGLPTVCGEPHPVSLLFIHGTLDAVIPWEGLTQDSSAGPVVVLASVAATLNYWASFSGCGADSDSRALPQRGLSPGTNVRVLSLRDCPAGYGLELVAVRGGGHNWPGQPDKLPAQIAGAVNLDLDASAFIWDFFAAHPKPGAR